MNIITRYPHMYILYILYIPSVLADNTQSNAFSAEASCYSLPYGDWGFFSHILTYYTVIVICCHKRPATPWIDSIPGSTWNRAIAIQSEPWLHATTPGIYYIPLSTLRPISRNSYLLSLRQFETIAAMKLALSLTSGFIAIFPSFWWLLLYLPGVIAGTAGTISLASSNFSPRMSTITAVFGGVGLAIAIATVFIFCLRFSGSDKNPFGTGALIGLSGYASCVPICLVFGALYSDWVLAIVADNLMGYPSGQSKSVQALWVLYMIGKRLNLLTI
ncbi:hypothetical protein BCON_0003g00170 [Botryotinia convoluta]|uniref:Uncharacterized protein n=1 Tax=Botryotinia convoluta TaxID=54673 RepID=A0A4Z1IWW0_9HELO|nr:hypothetical protein BCON_0003g00170 [Botryotinia convoluta]